ncbi:MAG: hypothetical protein GWP61_21850 [Chloroflexi bacterium]|jgi:hypothetical protein|nr:hypothetical protein [Chloroflexota bacterium]
MSTRENTTTNSGNSNEENNRFTRKVAPSLLFAGGVSLGVGYLLHLAGFGGWLTLVIAGASLFAAGGLWGDLRRFALLAVVVALVGAALCITALPDQIHDSATLAAAANLGVIISLVAAAVLIWLFIAPAWRGQSQHS